MSTASRIVPAHSRRQWLEYMAGGMGTVALAGLFCYGWKQFVGTCRRATGEPFGAARSAFRPASEASDLCLHARRAFACRHL
jgi:hypothetical protein